MHRRVRIERELASRVDQRVLRLFANMYILDMDRMDQITVLTGEVSGMQAQDRASLGCMDDVKVAWPCDSRGMTVDAHSQRIRRSICPGVYEGD